MSDQSKPRDAKVIPLDDLERRQFWAAIVLMIGIGLTLLGAMELTRTLGKSLDQVEELSERVERLNAPPASPVPAPPADSKSEPPKT